MGFGIVVIVALICTVGVIVYKKNLDYPGEDSVPPQVRHLSLYFLEFQFIPMFISSYRRGGHDERMFMNISAWQNIFKTKLKNQPGINWKMLKVTKINIGDLTYIGYTFPTPREVPEAKYGVVVLNSKEIKADYYTMEMSFGGKWVLGKTDPEYHGNLGSVEDVSSIDEFIFTVARANK